MVSHCAYCIKNQDYLPILCIYLFMNLCPIYYAINNNINNSKIFM